MGSDQNYSDQNYSTSIGTIGQQRGGTCGGIRLGSVGGVNFFAYVIANPLFTIDTNGLMAKGNLGYPANDR